MDMGTRNLLKLHSYNEQHKIFNVLLPIYIICSTKILKIYSKPFHTNVVQLILQLMVLMIHNASNTIYDTEIFSLIYSTDILHSRLISRGEIFMHWIVKILFMDIFSRL